jgi:hypothetical protein
MEPFKKHARHYIPLLGIMIAGIIGFLFFAYDRAFQAALAVSLCSAYVAWGVVHHKIHDDFDLFVLLEYLAVAFLGLVMILFLIYRT